MKNNINIVANVAEKMGGIRKMAEAHGVTYQAAWQWVKNGYFPLKQMSVVKKHFPNEISLEELAAAYEQHVANE